MLWMNHDGTVEDRDNRAACVPATLAQLGAFAWSYVPPGHPQRAPYAALRRNLGAYAAEQVELAVVHFTAPSVDLGDTLADITVDDGSAHARFARGLLLYVPEAHPRRPVFDAYLASLPPLESCRVAYFLAKAAGGLWRETSPASLEVW